jgi:hypothetical protein
MYKKVIFLTTTKLKTQNFKIHIFGLKKNYIFMSRFKYKKKNLELKNAIKKGFDFFPLCYILSEHDL